MRYASTDNFTKKVLYPAAECLLCEPAAERLGRVQKKLEKKGLGLKVWDCYRPLSVQKKLWDLVPDDRYVANPAKGSKHNRGASVDLTLVDKEGKELPMPTAFDEFSVKAHRDYMDLPADILQNRTTLEEAMESEGFIPLPTEWWHFDDPQWMNYALRDEPLNSPTLKTDKKADGKRNILPGSVSQLIVVRSQTWMETTGLLERYEKENGQWTRVGKAWPVSLGSKGMAWGRGLHSLDLNGPVKKESDKKAPAGIYKVGQAYGPSLTPPVNSIWPYQHINEKWFCVDDPKSVAYNRVVNCDNPCIKDWRSAEEMRRKDHLYDWVINIDQNFPDIKSDCGSCIFFHVWRKPGSPTEGCTAMSEENIRELLAWLKPQAQPHLVQLPKDIYEKLKSVWTLP